MGPANTGAHLDEPGGSRSYTHQHRYYQHAGTADAAEEAASSVPACCIAALPTPINQLSLNCSGLTATA
jgi:hypothetical protein